MIRVSGRPNPNTDRIEELNRLAVALEPRPQNCFLCEVCSDVRRAEKRGALWGFWISGAVFLLGGLLASWGLPWLVGQ